MQTFKSLILVFFLFSGSLFSQKGDDLAGKYRLPNGLDVQLFKTGDSWSGKIIALNDFKDGQSRDIKNPDKARRQDPLIGKVIIKDLRYDKEAKEWNGGTMYAPEKGMEFSLKVTEVRDDGIEVVGSKLIMHKTLFWKRL